MSKKLDFLGVFVGLIIVVFSIVVFNFDAYISYEKPESIKKVDGADSAPEKEENGYYGGDAYTGIQQAAAQAANNIIPVYYSVLQTNQNIKTVNETIGIQMESQAKNLELVLKALKTFFGYLLLSIGLLTVLKYLSRIFSTDNTVLVKSYTHNPATSFDVDMPVTEEHTNAPTELESPTNVTEESISI